MGARAELNKDEIVTVRDGDGRHQARERGRKGGGKRVLGKTDSTLQAYSPTDTLFPPSPPSLPPSLLSRRSSARTARCYRVVTLTWLVRCLKSECLSMVRREGGRKGGREEGRTWLVD